MTLDDLNHLVRTEPFKPFELELVNGRRITIRHPELILIPTNRRSQMVAYVAADTGLISHFNPMLVTEIRPLEDEPPAADRADSA